MAKFAIWLLLRSKVEQIYLDIQYNNSIRNKRIDFVLTDLLDIN